MKINIDKLANEVMKGLTEYKDGVNKDVKRAVRRAAKTVKQEIEENAPKDSGTYSKSWVASKTKETNEALVLTVNSKNRYQLAHLLEHGHAKRYGGRVSGKSHIAPAEQKGVEQLQSEIVRYIKNG